MLFSEVSRKQAFLTHISVSLCIFFILAYLIVFQWYPSFYFEHDGGDRGLLTIFVVDVVLGPGLTLLVFKQGKKGLKFDMVMILIFQVVALSWGIKSVYLSRPSLTVFYHGQFSCLSQDDIAPEVLGRLSKNSSSGPVLAFLRRPDTLVKYSDFIDKAYFSNSSEIYFYGDRFESVGGNNIDRIKSYELNVEEGIEKAKQRVAISKRNWGQYKNSNPVNEGLGYYPLKCRYKVGMAVFDFSKGKIVDYIDVYTKKAISNIELIVDEEEVKKGSAN